MPYKQLSNKSNSSAVYDNLLSGCESYASNRLQQVILTGCKSDRLSATSEFPRASILGPPIRMYIVELVKYSAIRVMLTIRKFI